MGFQGYQQIPKSRTRKLDRLRERKQRRVTDRLCWYGGLATDLRDSIFHDLLILHITLVSHKQLVDTFGRITVDFLEPLLHVVERIHVGNIIYNADAMSATVIRRCDGSESLLAGGVPLHTVSAIFEHGKKCSESSYNLKFHCFTVKLDSADFL